MATGNGAPTLTIVTPELKPTVVSARSIPGVVRVASNGGGRMAVTAVQPTLNPLVIVGGIAAAGLLWFLLKGKKRRR